MYILLRFLHIDDITKYVGCTEAVRRNRRTAAATHDEREVQKFRHGFVIEMVAKPSGPQQPAIVNGCHTRLSRPTIQTKKMLNSLESCVPLLVTFLA